MAAAGGQTGGCAPELPFQAAQGCPRLLMHRASGQGDVPKYRAFAACLGSCDVLSGSPRVRLAADGEALAVCGLPGRVERPDYLADVTSYQL